MLVSPCRPASCRLLIVFSNHYNDRKWCAWPRLSHHLSATAAERKTRLQARQLQNIFELTEAETRVAAMIGTGMNLSQFARLLGISPNTVKTHGSRCFDKTLTQSQAELAKLIAAIPIAGK